MKCDCCFLTDGGIVSRKQEPQQQFSLYRLSKCHILQAEISCIPEDQSSLSLHLLSSSYNADLCVCVHHIDFGLHVKEKKEKKEKSTIPGRRITLTCQK